MGNGEQWKCSQLFAMKGEMAKIRKTQRVRVGERKTERERERERARERERERARMHERECEGE